MKCSVALTFAVEWTIKFAGVENCGWNLVDSLPKQWDCRFEKREILMNFYECLIRVERISRVLFGQDGMENETCQDPANRL